MPFRQVITYTQNRNENFIQYDNPTAMMENNSVWSDISIDSAFDRLEEITPGCWNNRKDEILSIIKNQTIQFDVDNQVVIKTRIWPDEEAYNIYEDAWDNPTTLQDAEIYNVAVQRTWNEI